MHFNCVNLTKKYEMILADNNTETVEMITSQWFISKQCYIEHPNASLDFLSVYGMICIWVLF